MSYHKAMTPPAKTILCVEDDPSQRDFYSKVLGSRGYRVIFAEDAVQATMYCRQSRPDFVIMDYQIPAGTGGNLYHTFRKFPAGENVPILFISGSSTAAGELDAVLRGDSKTRFLGKPVGVRELLAIVEKMLARQAASDQAVEGPLQLD